MDTIQLNLENLSEEEREQLMKLVKKANKQKSKVWKPVKDDEYYYLDGAGSICKEHFDPKSQWDEKAYNIGNAFRTLEEAIEESKRRKILTQWKRLSIEAGENENPWDNRHGHWSCFYSVDMGCFREVYTTTAKDESMYFPTKESLHDAIKTIGEDNVKRYILGVTDE